VVGWLFFETIRPGRLSKFTDFQLMNMVSDKFHIIFVILIFFLMNFKRKLRALGRKEKTKSLDLTKIL
jgi:hypothetical protein